jgi:hypothetical protein
VRPRRREPSQRTITVMLSLGDYIYFAVYLTLGGIAALAVFFAIPLALMSGAHAVNWILPAHKAVQARYSAHGSRLDYASHVTERER